jgi:hypothetical protein
VSFLCHIGTWTEIVVITQWLTESRWTMRRARLVWFTHSLCIKYLAGGAVKGPALLVLQQRVCCIVNLRLEAMKTLLCSASWRYRTADHWAGKLYKSEAAPLSLLWDLLPHCLSFLSYQVYTRLSQACANQPNIIWNMTSAYWIRAKVSPAKSVVILVLGQICSII